MKLPEPKSGEEYFAVEIDLGDEDTTTCQVLAHVCFFDDLEIQIESVYDETGTDRRTDLSDKAYESLMDELHETVMECLAEKRAGMDEDRYDAMKYGYER